MIALPRTGIIYRTRFILYNVLQGGLVYWEVYLSTRLSLTPAGMWKYVWSRLNFIYEQIGTGEPSRRLVMEAKNLKEPWNSCPTETWKTLTVFERWCAGFCSGRSNNCSLCCFCCWINALFSSLKAQLKRLKHNCTATRLRMMLSTGQEAAGDPGEVTEDVLS